MMAAEVRRLGMLGFIMTFIMGLSILAVSFENESWGFWGGRNGAWNKQHTFQSELFEPDPNSGTGLAHAMPVGNLPSENDGQLGEFNEVKSGRDHREPLSTGVVEENVVEENFNSGTSGHTAIHEDVVSSGPVSPAPNPAKDILTNTDVRERINVPRDSVKRLVPGEGVGMQDTLEPANESPKQKLQENLDSNSEDPNAMMDNDNDKAQYLYKSQRRSRAKTFLVVFMGHSGSTAFTTEFRSHTEFEVELLEPLEHGVFERNTDLALKRARDLMDKGIAKGKIPGFKIRPFHINNMPEKWRDFVKEYDTRVIWQYRENIVKQAIGEYRHRFLNDTSVVEGLEQDEKPCAKGSNQKCRIRIDNMRGLHELMNDFSANDELLGSAVRNLRRENDMSIVRYEDYLYRRERTMREVFNFLGVDYQDTAPQRQKASPDNLCKMVSNFQEVCDRFLLCQLWRPFFHDDNNHCWCKAGSWRSFDSTYCRRSAWHQWRD